MGLDSAGVFNCDLGAIDMSDELTSADFSAPRPWALVDNSASDHPHIAIASDGRNEGSFVAYKYAPAPHEVHDFAHIVDCVNGITRKADVNGELLETAQALLDASERHIFGDECLAERNAARAAIAKASKP